VTAVEIGANMAEFLRERYRGETLDVVVAAFEDAALEENSYDLIYAASAFHWVDAEIGCPKAFRLLKSGGTFALFRFNQLPGDGDKVYEEIQAAYEKHFSIYKPYKRPVRLSHDDFHKPSEIYRGFRFYDLKDYGFSDITVKLYDASRTFSTGEYMDMLDTFADHRGLPDDDRAALYAGIKEAILRHGGRHRVDYVFQLYMGRKNKK